MSWQWHVLGRRVARRWLATFLGATLVASCQAVENPVRSDAIFFPQPEPHAGPTVKLTALGSGTLVLENGCLWLKNESDRDLIIWPSSYDLETREGQLVVLDATGAAFAHVGRPITIGGGELTSAESRIDANVWVESKIGRPIPSACRVGRYWDAAGSPANVR